MSELSWPDVVEPRCTVCGARLTTTETHECPTKETPDAA